MPRFYLSNLSETWPIARQEQLLDETCPGWRDQSVYRDVLSKLGLKRGDKLTERDDFLLRKAGRTEDGGEVVVATLLAIARTQTDMTSVLVRLSGRHETLRSIAEDMAIDPATQDLDELKRAFHNAARRFSAKGVPGGVASGQRRSEAARARIREFIKPLWHLPLPPVAELCKKYKVSRPTVIDELGNRKEAQQRYVDELRKQMHALKVAEANRRRRKHEPESDTCV